MYRCLSWRPQHSRIPQQLLDEESHRQKQTNKRGSLRLVTVGYREEGYHALPKPQRKSAFESSVFNRAVVDGG